MYTSQASQVMLGRGKVFFDRFTTAGVKTGFRYLGDVSKAEITTKDEKAQIFDYGVATAPLLNEVVTKREVTIGLTMHEYTKENVALVLMGVESTYTQTSSTVSAESLTTSSVLGRTYKTAKRNISTVVVHQAAATLVLGTDYAIADAVTGLITLLEGSVTITPGSTITVDYAYAAITSLDTVQAANSPAIKGALLFVGDPGSGPAWDCEVWLVTVSPNGAIGLITGSDFGAMSLDCKVLPDAANHATEPYYKLTRKS